MKKCPFCAEQIQDEAIKCRYCGSMLPGAQPPPTLDTPLIHLPDPVDDPVDVEARRLLNAFQKIDAIKLVRDKKGLSLAAAKARVEALDAPKDAGTSIDPLASSTAGSTFPLWLKLLMLAMVAGAVYDKACSAPPVELSSWPMASPSPASASVSQQTLTTSAGVIAVGQTWDEALPKLNTGTRVEYGFEGPDRAVEVRQFGPTRYRLVFQRDSGGPLTLISIAALR